MLFKKFEDVDLKGKKVLIRFDFNVPLSKTEPREITDDSRIELALPTLRLVLEKGASKVILMSHLGRPDGKVNPKYSLEPVATYLAKVLNQEVVLTEAPVDNGLKEFLQLPNSKIVLLENLRFSPEEEKNGSEFAEKLAQCADFYINDAFGAAHRKHASVYAITASFKNRAFAGLLMRKEVEVLQHLLEKPSKPYYAVLGGAKVADKIKTIEKLLVIVDKIFIGGAMAYPFLKAKGIAIGKSLCSEEDVQLAKSLLQQDRAKKIQLPVDHVCSAQIDQPGKATREIAADQMGLDIGPQTCELYSSEIAKAKTIFWNGPMGLFENPHFAQGTMAIAKAIAHTSSFSVVGGGDSVAAVEKSGFASSFTHVSTGGGASLEFIEKGDLPGVQALRFGIIN